jgi:hypothetical protein
MVARNMGDRERTIEHHPGPEWRRTLAAILSAMIVSAVVWGIVVFFDVH